MTCKDCLHYKVCCDNDLTYDDYVLITSTDGECPNFADRSEWVHLPCERVYFICDKGTKFSMVMSKPIRDLSICEIKEIDKSGYYFSAKEKAEKELEEKK